ncbi:MAG: biotin/lipoyl-binding protein, partial [Chloroflexota bacterium]
MNLNRLAIVLVLLTIAIPVSVGVTRAPNGNTPIQSRAANNPASDLTLHTITVGDVTATVSGLGTLEPTERVSLSFDAGGRVEAVYVAEGDTVAVADVLAELNNDTLTIEHGQALLAIDRAEIDLLELVEPVTDDDIALAQARIDTARAAYTAAITAVSPAEIDAAELQYAQAQIEYDALVESRIWRSGTEEEVALIEAEIGAASFDTEIARLNAENTRNATTNPAVYVAEIREAELGYEALFVGPSAYDLEAAEIRVERAYA